ncbi:MAG: hypothetical protein HY329_04730 [Chloroflexi bacterium]|nr:hypothetical protein [Chloroflexota bacterium]
MIAGVPEHYGGPVMLPDHDDQVLGAAEVEVHREQLHQLLDQRPVEQLERTLTRLSAAPVVELGELGLALRHHSTALVQIQDQFETPNRAAYESIKGHHHATLTASLYVLAYRVMARERALLVEHVRAHPALRIQARAMMTRTGATTNQ